MYNTITIIPIEKMPPQIDPKIPAKLITNTSLIKINSYTFSITTAVPLAETPNILLLNIV